MTRHPRHCPECGMHDGHRESCSHIVKRIDGTSAPLILSGGVTPKPQPREGGGILIISGVEILCQRDLILGPLVAHEFRISVDEGRAVVDAKCPVCGEVSRVEFFT